ncbi:C2H2-type zinc finger protein [Candidatus Sororendozoicomonas aggregata]|uniref:C2H2-type zinc finger protein n=1 Tax=Candidatus Sororendozoicomonas aggregata TaxID=3073239 RepID=UPI002ED07743
MPKDHICVYCDKRFDTPYKLKGHIRTHTGEKPYICLTCGTGFAEQSTLITHIRTHTGEKPYKCDVCGKCFSRSNTLKIHVRIHTGEKPYVCTACGKGHAQRFGLKQHKCGIQTRFDCPVCPEKGFSSDKTYKAHMLEKHPDYHEHELSISPPQQPQAFTSYASPSEVSINRQTIPGVGTIYAVTHTTTWPTTGVVTKAAQISGPSGVSVVVTQTITTPRPATATATISTATRPVTSTANAQPYPIEVAAVAQQAPGPSFSVPRNPLEVPIMDFEDLRNAWEEDKSPW